MTPRLKGLRFLLLLSAATIIQLSHPVLAADVTEGPLAAVSIKSEDAYQTARACAAGCLAYQGSFGCNNRGYYDLGVDLQCGCGPLNNCYCNTKYASSATKYVSECVKGGCKVDDWPDEVSSMLDLYNNYCATANVAVKTTDFVAGPTTAPSDDTLDTQTTDTTNPTRATQTGSPGSDPTATSSATPNEEKKDGLSQSDIVALAASLGVGIPSLLIAVITLVVQLRKKKRKAAERDSAAPAAASNVHLIHLHTGSTTTPPAQPQPHVQYDTSTYSYELGAQKEGNRY